MPENKKLGRPTGIPYANRKDEIIKVRIVADEKIRLENFSRITGRSMSDVVREAIKFYIDMGIDIYECDPDKNITCTKSGCKKDGGPCHCTTVKEFAKDLETENYRYV